MKRTRYFAGWAVTTVLLLASAAGALADEKSCRAAMSKAHEGYLIAVSKAKAKEARGRLPGQNPVRPGVTAQKIARARQKADQTIAAGCVGVASPDAADPNQCVGLDFDDCLSEMVTQSDAAVDALQAAVVPQGPICLENPVCDLKDGLPPCDPDNGCFCHNTAEGDVNCINEFSCELAQLCVFSPDCPPGQVCYVNTCCGQGVCGPATCQPGGTGASTGARSATVE